MISKETLTSRHPHESLSSMQALTRPYFRPLTTNGFKILIHITRTLDLEMMSIGSSPINRVRAVHILYEVMRICSSPVNRVGAIRNGRRMKGKDLMDSVSQ
jgi:hypothetical protein